MSNDNDTNDDLKQLAAMSAGSAKAGAMSNAHVMDWEPLNLGHQIVSMREVNLIDLGVQVFGLDEISGSELPIAIVMLAHGWANKARDMHPMASGIIGEAKRLDALGGRKRTRDVLVVTIDQRNHGERRRIRDKLSFKTSQSGYAKYMAMAVTGGVHDHQLIMDFLPGQLFPRDERKVVEFMSTGFSMGGHVTWRLLRHDPRVRIGVPICSVPSDALRNRLVVGGDGFLPQDTLKFFNTPCEEGVYVGSKVLAVHGGVDKIMPFELGEEKWPRIRAEAEASKVVLDAGYGHVVSRDMVRATAEWMWRWGLTEAK